MIIILKKHFNSKTEILKEYKIYHTLATKKYRKDKGKNQRKNQFFLLYFQITYLKTSYQVLVKAKIGCEIKMIRLYNIDICMLCSSPLQFFAVDC